MAEVTLLMKVTMTTDTVGDKDRIHDKEQQGKLGELSFRQDHIHTRKLGPQDPMKKGKVDFT